MSAIQKYSDSSQVGEFAVMQVKYFLESTPSTGLWFETAHVHDVQQDRRYQNLGIDLLWIARASQGVCSITVEVKGDRNDSTGNFFIETISDLQWNTPGAFLICQAEWYFYYFVNTGVLYCLPMHLLKPWFLNLIDSFDERSTQSEHEGRRWTTMGRLVPISKVLAEVPDIRCFNLFDGSSLGG